MKPVKPLRLWPGVVAVVLLWLARFGIKAVVPGFQGFAWSAQGGILGAIAVILWWLFFSRAAWLDRIGGIVLMIAAMGATWSVKHESMGPFWVIAYAVPVLCLAFVVSAVAARHFSLRARRVTMAVTTVLACGVWGLVRTEGINGDHVATFAWRWSRTPEERAVLEAPVAPPAVRTPTAEPATSAPGLARGEGPATSEPAIPRGGGSVKSEPVGTRAEGLAVSEPATVRGGGPAMSEPAIMRAEWPGFRGPQRDGIVRGARIETNWAASPPVELWRRRVGPAWSSIAVRGNLLYTQEQRGDHEVVACYNAATGQPVWTHSDAARFFESNAGAGPRGTPTLAGDRVYTFGGTGILNALDAASGVVVWSRNVTTDHGADVPTWGFSSSPVVVDDLVVVAAAGQLLAYDARTGSPRWAGAKAEGYSSPHLATIGGVTQILLMGTAGTTSVAPADGKMLWQHPWRGSSIVQPAVLADGDVLLVAGTGSGTRRVKVVQGPSGWSATERWRSNGLKPYFNDFVVHKGYAFGFDGSILASINLEDGQRTWKGGRYGNGQLLLLADQDLLLVLAEEGDVALVKATPDAFTEVARFRAIEGKTWNHPVLIGDLLLVRNGEEMAAFRLPLARRSTD